MAKLKLASYWAAACGGCDVAILDIHEKILDLAAAADILFWPIAMDFKYADVEAMPDGHIDVTLFHGAVRNSENEHLAHLLRAKSKVLVAFGTCAHIGGIPGLANLFTREEIFKRVYHESPSTVNPENLRPQTKVAMPEGEHDHSGVLRHRQNAEPGRGCRLLRPRLPPDTKADLECRAGDRQRQPSAQGRGGRGLRKDAVRRVHAQEAGKEDHRLQANRDGSARPGQLLSGTGLPVPGTGDARRLRHALPAIRRGMPRLLRSSCRRCLDQGAKAISAIASVIEAKDEAEMERIIDEIPDPLRSFNRFGIPDQLLIRGKHL